MTDTVRRQADKTIAKTMEFYDKAQARFERDKLNIKEKFDASFFGGLPPQVAFVLIGMFNRAQNSFGTATLAQPQPA